MRYALAILLILLAGCAVLDAPVERKEPVTVLWPTEQFEEVYAREYLWPQHKRFWAFEAGFGSDGRVYWRTNAAYDRAFQGFLGVK